jgi:hypothetical protein
VCADGRRVATEMATFGTNSQALSTQFVQFNLAPDERGVSVMNLRKQVGPAVWLLVLLSRFTPPNWDGFQTIMIAGGNLGVSNYRDDAERRLLRNAAEAEQTFRTVSKLAKTNPAQAREYMHDPDNAAYVLFHRDFGQAVTVLRRMDQAKERIEGSGLSASGKQIRLNALESSRPTQLGHVEALNSVLFERRQKVSHLPLGPEHLNQPRTATPLAVQ